MTAEQREKIVALLQRELSNAADNAYRAALKARNMGTEHDKAIAAEYKKYQDEASELLEAFKRVP